MSVPAKPQQPTPAMPKDAGKLRRAWQTLLIIAICLPTLFLIAGAHSAPGLAVGGQIALVTGSRIHLPVVLNAGDFYLAQPIWAPEGQAGAHQVVLFRVEFDLPQVLSEVELRLFADTRYQARIATYRERRTNALFRSAHAPIVSGWRGCPARAHAKTASTSGRLLFPRFELPGSL